MSDYIDITPEQLVETLVDACATYTDDVKKKVHKGIDKIAREAKPEVKEKSPKRKKKAPNIPYDQNTIKHLKELGIELKGEDKSYNESWTTTKTESNGVYTVTVHNKKWQLVHLLEFGHLTRKGTGRTAGKGKESTEAIAHVEPTQKHVEEKVDKLLEEL